MNVIAPRTLRAFWEKHPHAETPLQVWLKMMRGSNFTSFSELHAVFPSADYVAAQGLTIFNIGGNKYRLVTFIRYTSQTVFIKRVMTHAEYTKWNAQGRP